VFFVLGTFVAICIVFFWFVIPLVVIIGLYSLVQRYYVATSRELQRLDSISKSPIVSHYSESLAGASSIRAYGCRERFLRENEARVDANHRNVLAYQAALCWLAVRIEMMSTVLCTCSAIFAVSSRDSVDAALVGLTVVYSSEITSSIARHNMFFTC
jgi:ABC-type multidrug transport system fused ATPase/permease subunit